MKIIFPLVPRLALLAGGLVAPLASAANLNFAALADLEGHPAALTAPAAPDSRRIVFFWATWCPTCKAKLTDVLPRLKTPQLEVVTVNMDEDPGRARNYVRKYDVKLPVFSDPGQKAQRELNVTTSPHWAVFKPEGAGWALIDAAPGFDTQRLNHALGKDLL
jgi:thiol-disulfide isomerase/thioredoxin